MRLKQSKNARAYNSKFNPVGQFDLQIDLNKGTANVTSSNGIGKANVTVNHPTEVIEVPSKPIIKRR